MERKTCKYRFVLHQHFNSHFKEHNSSTVTQPKKFRTAARQFFVQNHLEKISILYKIRPYFRDSLVTVVTEYDVGKNGFDFRKKRDFPSQPDLHRL